MLITDAKTYTVALIVIVGLWFCSKYQLLPISFVDKRFFMLGKKTVSLPSSRFIPYLWIVWNADPIWYAVI